MRAQWLSMLALMLCLLPCAAIAELGWAVSGGDVVFYQQPDPYAQSATIQQGTWVWVDSAYGNFFAAQTEDGRTGYVSASAVYHPLGDEMEAGRGFLMIPMEHYDADMAIVSNPKGTSFLNLRASPSYSAKVLGYYYNGVPCIITDRGRSDGWYSVTVDGLRGYFRSEYLAPLSSHAGYSSRVATIRTPDQTALNLRSGPGKDYHITRQYHDGDYVMLLAKGSSWWRVITTDGYTGFMSADFLKEGVFTPSGDSSVLAGNETANEPYALVCNPKVTQVLNLRESPSVTARVLGQFPQGARFLVLAQGMEWCHVQSASGVSGYMMTDYLQLNHLPEIPTARVEHPQHTYVNLRSSPSQAQDNILSAVPHGAEVTIMIPGDVWTKVRYHGQTGWMMACYLK